MAEPIPINTPIVTPTTSSAVPDTPPPNFDFQQVVDFYNNAWNMLMSAGGILLAVLGVIGIIWPILMYIFQIRSLKQEEERIKKDLKEYVDSIELKLKTEQENIQGELTNMSKKIQDKLSRLVAATYLNYGKIEISKKNYKGGVLNYIGGAMEIIPLNDFKATSVMLNPLNTYLSKLDNEEILELEDQIVKLIDQLKKVNQDGRYSDAIRNLEKYINQAAVSEE